MQYVCEIIEKLTSIISRDFLLFKSNIKLYTKKWILLQMLFMSLRHQLGHTNIE